MDLRRISAVLVGCLPVAWLPLASLPLASLALACSSRERPTEDSGVPVRCDAADCSGSRDSGHASIDGGDRFSNCQLGAGECAAGERCAWGRLPSTSWTGTRCTAEPGTLGEGEACALDVHVTFPDGSSLETSRCADDLVCFVPLGATGTCTRPCHLLGCDAGEICPGYWRSCVTVVACDPESQDPCAASERCAFVRPIGGAPGWVCTPTGDGALGTTCSGDADCARELGCLHGRCTTRCDATPVATSPDGGTGTPLPDGGVDYPPTTATCADGSLCVDDDPDDDAPIGLCATDLFSDCRLDDPTSCGAGERCAWGLVDPTTHRPGTRCVTESGTLAAGESCTLDVAVSFSDGSSFRTSRCGAGLGCAPYGPDAGRCVVPCDAVGCPAGQLCPGLGEECIADVRCDPITGAPCAADQDCEGITTWGAGWSFVYVCRDRGGVGDACSSDWDCEPSLGCTSSGRCATTCDPTWYPVPPGSDGAVPLPDGGALREPRCADGSYCVPHMRFDGTHTGLCVM